MRMLQTFKVNVWPLFCCLFFKEPKKAKPVSKSDGGGLFADDDDDLFGAPQTKPAKKGM